MAGPEDADLRIRLLQPASSWRTRPASSTTTRAGLTLRDVLRKRVYYGGSLPAFAANNPGRGRGQQALATMRAFVRHRGRLARDPVHGVGLLVLRALEAAGYAVARCARGAAGDGRPGGADSRARSAAADCVPWRLDRRNSVDAVPGLRPPCAATWRLPRPGTAPRPTAATRVWTGSGWPSPTAGCAAVVPGGRRVFEVGFGTGALLRRFLDDGAPWPAPTRDRSGSTSTRRWPRRATCGRAASTSSPLTASVTTSCSASTSSSTSPTSPAFADACR